MDEPGAGFVHGRGERRGCLETVAVIIIFAALVFGGFAGGLHFLLLITRSGEPVTNSLKTAINRKRPKHVASVRMVRLGKAGPSLCRSSRAGRAPLRRIGQAIAAIRHFRRAT